MISFFNYLLHKIKSSYGLFRIRRKLKTLYPSISWPSHFQIYGPIENMHLGSQIQWGEYIVLHVGGYEWSRHVGSLSIGDNGIISSHCVIYAAGPGGVEIGKNFDCAPGVKIFSSKSFYDGGQTKHEFKKVTIGNNVVIYANAVIGPGVSIVDNVTIAANSVVTQNIMEAGLYGGSPARKIQ